MEPRRQLALTLGEPAGIGLDIAIEAWLARRSADIPPFVFVGDFGVLARRAKSLGRVIQVETASPAEAFEIFAHALHASKARRQCWGHLARSTPLTRPR